MALKEHVKMLLQNVVDWNNWRKLHYNILPNLTQAKLSGADLSGADLSRAKLSKANLTGAKLNNANLSGAKLSGANLGGADLSNANLIFTDLSGAMLNDAMLNDAMLIGAKLIKTDLSGADLSGADLSGAIIGVIDLSGAKLRDTKLRDTMLRNRYKLSKANLKGAKLNNADLSGTNLSGQDLSNKNLGGANLSGANLSGANLSGANLSGANLSGANLSGQDLSHKDLSEANLSGANLSKTLLIETNFTGATLTDCNIYGIAAWNVKLEHAIQKNLIITQEGEATITVDNLKVAQFIYLMLNNKEIRDVINALTTKSVLILGRFTPERKAILDAIREKLRAHNYLPILFDFEKPSRLDLTETVATLAHLAKFIIADLTAQSSVPHELQAIIPTLAIPIQPLVLEDERSYALFTDLKKYHWVLPIHSYKNQTELMASLKEHIIDPAEHKAEELEKIKNNT